MSKVRISINHPGSLTNLGYHLSLPAKQRHISLLIAAHKYGIKNLVRKINALVVFNKNRTKYKTKLETDIAFVKALESRGQGLITSVVGEIHNNLKKMNPMIMRGKGGGDNDPLESDLHPGITFGSFTSANPANGIRMPKPPALAYKLYGGPGGLKPQKIPPRGITSIKR